MHNNTFIHFSKKHHNITMIVLIKPILMAFLSSSAVKELVIQLLEAYAESTDNTIDDKAVELIKKNLFPGTKE